MMRDYCNVNGDVPYFGFSWPVCQCTLYVNYTRRNISNLRRHAPSNESGFK